MVVLILNAALGVNGFHVVRSQARLSAGSGSMAERFASYKRVWSASLSVNADSTPVVDKGVTLPTGKRATLVFVLAGNDASDCSNPVKLATTYAFVAATGRLLWRRSTSGQARCTTAAPAVWRRWIFSPGLDGFVHRYAAGTGEEFKKQGWPQRYTLIPSVEKSSANLVVSGHYLYITTSGFNGDAGHYDGHLVTINLDTNRKHVWNSLCSNLHKLLDLHSKGSNYCPQRRSGMFGRGQAVIEPTDRDVYVVTGNGPWNGRTDWGDSILRLNPEGTRLLDSFTPTNQAYLNTSDSDLGSTGPAILPPVTSGGRTWHLMVQGGKGPAGTSGSGPTVLWLVNRDQMERTKGPGHLGDGLQHIASPGGCEVLTAPAVWVDSTGRPTIIYADDCGVTAYGIGISRSRLPKLTVRWNLSTQHNTTPVILGDTVFIAHNGAVDALDPANGKTTWSSSWKKAGGTIGSLHWEYPAAAGRMLFMTDENAHLFAYLRK